MQFTRKVLCRLRPATPATLNTRASQHLRPQGRISLLTRPQALTNKAKTKVSIKRSLCSAHNIGDRIYEEYLARTCGMAVNLNEAGGRNSNAMRARIQARSNTLLTNFRDVLDQSMSTEDDDLGTTAMKAYKLEMATQSMIRASEDLLTLVRQMQEIWLFGNMNTLGRSKVEEKTEEDAKAIVELLGKLGEMRGKEGKE